VHGGVHPFWLAPRASLEALDHVRSIAGVPLWLPTPMPTGWLVSGVGHAGDERTGARATLLACSGPAPLGGPADLVLVAEDPGVGLGGRFAGLPGPDPGAEVTDAAPHAKVEAAGHPTPLWSLPADDRAAFVGAAMGLWLWAVLWPVDAGLLLLEDLVLRDARDGVPEPTVDFGALSPRLTGPAAVTPPG
jgi:hypothetical protein